MDANKATGWVALSGGFVSASVKADWSDRGKLICRIEEGMSPHRQELAEMIALRVNAHDAMRKALRKADLALVRYAPAESLQVQDARFDIKAALALADGEKGEGRSMKAKAEKCCRCGRPWGAQVVPMGALDFCERCADRLFMIDPTGLKGRAGREA